MQSDTDTFGVSNGDRMTVLLDDLREDLQERNDRLDRIERKLDAVLSDTEDLDR